jgi:hypothetical protein
MFGLIVEFVAFNIYMLKKEDAIIVLRRSIYLKAITDCGSAWVVV